MTNNKHNMHFLSTSQISGCRVHVLPLGGLDKINEWSNNMFCLPGRRYLLRYSKSKLSTSLMSNYANLSLKVMFYGIYYYYLICIYYFI
jgi:hypothetical protein